MMRLTTFTLLAFTQLFAAAATAQVTAPLAWQDQTRIRTQVPNEWPTLIPAQNRRQSPSQTPRAPADKPDGPGDLPENAEVVASLWCDTADQLETVLKAHYHDKVPMGEAMAAINRFSPEACIVARAIVKAGGEVRRLTAGDNIMSLRSARVHGIVRGGYALMMTPQTWFYVKIIAELTPL